MSLPTGFAGYSDVRTTSISPFHRRSPDHALAYAEELTTDYERGDDLIALRSWLARLIKAASFVPRVIVAALLTVSLATAATALLVVPGVWLYTRWSLAVPVICKEDMGPVASLKRS